MAMIVDNPAARLLDILKAGKTHQNIEICRNVWHAVLKVELGDHALLTARLAEVMALPREIAMEMQEHYPDESAMVAHWRGQVDAAFVKLHLASQWDSFASMIDQHSMMHLSSTAKLLQHVTTFKPVPNTDLDGIRDKLSELLLEVRNSELDPDLKLAIVKHLAKIQTAVDEYFITGVAPVLDAVNAAYGRAFTDVQYRELITGKSTLGEKLRFVLNDVAMVTTVAANLHEIGPALKAGWTVLVGG